MSFYKSTLSKLPLSFSSKQPSSSSSPHHQHQQEQQQQPLSNNYQTLPKKSMYIPHRGSLCRIHININNTNISKSYNQPTSFLYTITIFTPHHDHHHDDHQIHSCKKGQYTLQYHPEHYQFLEDIFTILDKDSRGYISKKQVEEFVLLRCPVFKRRDDILKIFCDDNNNIDDDDNNNDCGDGCISSKDYDIEKLVMDGSSTILEKQNEQDIYNCILGEDFQSVGDNYEDCNDDNDDDNDDDDDDDYGNGMFFATEEEEVIKSDKEDNTNIIVEHNPSMNNQPSIDYHHDNNKDSSNDSERIIQSQTFEEIWDAVIQCSVDKYNNSDQNNNDDQNVMDDDQQQTYQASPLYIGIEAWMVFCRFISLAQYQDAKRWFSTRHLQQSIAKRNSSNNKKSDCDESFDSNSPKSELHKSDSNNEVVLVDVPMPERPTPISTQHLIEYELMMLKKSENNDDHDHDAKDLSSIGYVGIPLPELDLDHSHLFTHDNDVHESKQNVKIEVFGTQNHTTYSSTSDKLEFVIHLTPNLVRSDSKQTTDDTVLVRRSFSDMSWLHDTFKSQKKLGGTLCGRIIPPFPMPLNSYSRSPHYDEEKLSSTSTSSTMSVASASAVMVTSAAKSAKRLLSHFSLSSSSSNNSHDKKSLGSSDNDKLSAITRRHSTSIHSKYSSLRDKILDNPESKSKQLERYINYMLDHPAMSTSFPLNVMLKVRDFVLFSLYNESYFTSLMLIIFSNI